MELNAVELKILSNAAISQAKQAEEASCILIKQYEIPTRASTTMHNSSQKLQILRCKI